MAHIPDGLLSLPVLAGAAVLAAGGVALGLRRIEDRAIPRIAILSGVFFAASALAVPIGPTSVHLMLSGLMGVMLGWGIFPAVLVALMLQLLFFGFGGLTTLGVNLLNIAGPGALIGLVLGSAIRAAPPRRAAVLAALAGAGAALGTGAMVALALWLSAPEFAPVARVLALTYLPLAAAEAAIAAAVVGFLARVEPAALALRLAPGED